MSKVTVQEYAKHRGIGACQVRRYVKSGVLDGAVTRDGWRIYIDKAKANRLLAKSITPRKVLLDKGPVPSPSGKKTETAAEQRAVLEKLYFRHAARVFGLALPTAPKPPKDLEIRTQP